MTDLGKPDEVGDFRFRFPTLHLFQLPLAKFSYISQPNVYIPRAYSRFESTNVVTLSTYMLRH